MSNITEKDAIKFLIQCYFGDIDDPVLAAIDRAYVDMQTHTLSGEKEVLYKGRYEGRAILRDSIGELSKAQSFDKWHKETADKLKSGNPALTYGQIQKWINRSIKYLYTFKLLGVEGIDEYFNSDNSKKFHPALDSYVLDAIGEKVKWSKIDDYCVYNSIRQKLTFNEEYINWPKYAHDAGVKKNGEAKTPDKGTYKRYVWDLKHKND